MENTIVAATEEQRSLKRMYANFLGETKCLPDAEAPTEEKIREYKTRIDNKLRSAQAKLVAYRPKCQLHLAFHPGREHWMEAVFLEEKNWSAKYSDKYTFIVDTQDDLDAIVALACDSWEVMKAVATHASTLEAWRLVRHLKELTLKAANKGEG